MPDMQEQINKILSDPEAMRQVQSLGEQLGLNTAAVKSEPKPPPVSPVSPEITGMMSTLAPLMSASAPDSQTAALLNALRPFLSPERAQKLDRAQKIIGLIRVIPLIRKSGIF